MSGSLERAEEDLTIRIFRLPPPMISIGQTVLGKAQIAKLGLGFPLRHGEWQWTTLYCILRGRA